MSKPKSLSEAIRQLDDVSQSNSSSFNETLEKDYAQIKKAVEDIKPYLDKIKEGFEEKVTEKIHEAKDQVETKVRDNIWISIGIVGLFGVIIGWIFGWMLGHRHK